MLLVPKLFFRLADVFAASKTYSSMMIDIILVIASLLTVQSSMPTTGLNEWASARSLECGAAKNTRHNHSCDTLPPAVFSNGTTRLHTESPWPHALLHRLFCEATQSVRTAGSGNFILRTRQQLAKFPCQALRHDASAASISCYRAL